MKGVAWAKMSLPKDEGGLGLKDPELLNQTMAFKLLVRIWN